MSTLNGEARISVVQLETGELEIQLELPEDWAGTLPYMYRMDTAYIETQNGKIFIQITCESKEQVDSNVKGLLEELRTWVTENNFSVEKAAEVLETDTLSINRILTQETGFNIEMLMELNEQSYNKP